MNQEMALRIEEHHMKEQKGTVCEPEQPEGTIKDELADLSGPGRPSKYTPETIEKLLKALRNGLTQKQACLASVWCRKAYIRPSR
jgi:hypothetical protein